MDNLEKLSSDYAEKIHKTIDNRLMYQCRKPAWKQKIAGEIYQLCATLKDNVAAKVFLSAIADAEHKFKGFTSPEELKSYIKKPATNARARFVFLFTGKLS